MAFGEAKALWRFTKTIRVLVEKWRQAGIQQLRILLDDILIFAETESQLKEHIQTVMSDLDRAGLILNDKKSILCPTTCLKWDGILIDTVKGLFTPERRKAKNH